MNLGDETRSTPDAREASSGIRDDKSVAMPPKNYVGESDDFPPFVNEARQYADSTEPVLLLGETGSGKNFLAETIHGLSSNNRGLFVPVSLAGLDDNLVSLELFGSVKGAFTGAEDKAGAFEAADGGTIFLDEFGDISIPLQLKLLQVLNNGTFSRVGESKRVRKSTARVICATNRNLKSAIVEGTFRKELYYRVAVFSIELPPLRARRQEVMPLAKKFFRKLLPEASRAHADEFAMLLSDQFSAYDWPGNVRELLTAVKIAVMAIGNGVSATAAMQTAFNKCQALRIDDSPDTAFDAAGISFCVDYIKSWDQAQPSLTAVLNGNFGRWIDEALRRVPANILPTTLTGIGKMLGGSALARGQFNARPPATKAMQSPVMSALMNNAQAPACRLPPKVRDAFLNRCETSVLTLGKGG